MAAALPERRDDPFWVPSPDSSRRCPWRRAYAAPLSGTAPTGRSA